MRDFRRLSPRLAIGTAAVGHHRGKRVTTALAKHAAPHSVARSIQKTPVHCPNFPNGGANSAQTNTDFKSSATLQIYHASLADNQNRVPTVVRLFITCSLTKTKRTTRRANTSHEIGRRAANRRMDPRVQTFFATRQKGRTCKFWRENCEEEKRERWSVAVFGGEPRDWAVICTRALFDVQRKRLDPSASRARCDSVGFGRRTVVCAARAHCVPRRAAPPR